MAARAAKSFEEFFKVRKDKKINKKERKIRHNIRNIHSVEEAKEWDEIDEEDKKLKQQRRVDSFRFNDSNFRSGGSLHITGKPYSKIYRPGFNSEDGSVEFTDYDLAAAGSSVINKEPEFKNKIEESIYRLKKSK